jgi:hypothetical protein
MATPMNIDKVLLQTYKNLSQQTKTKPIVAYADTLPK